MAREFNLSQGVEPMRTLSILALFVLSAWTLALAQDPGKSIDAEASQAYSQHEWEKSEQLYGQLAQTHPDDAHFWYRYAVSAQADKHYEAALHAFTEAKRTGKGLPATLIDYDIASTQAAMGHTDEAFASLKSAAAAGYAQPDQLESNVAWNSLRSDPQYAPLLDQTRRNLAPCKYSAESRQFDFWVGDWDVVSSFDGHPVGSSHIAQELGECVIWENWTSAGLPYAGKSYNAYNTTLKRWEQFWVDNSQGMIFFYGNLKDGVMDFMTDEIPQPNGTKIRRHLQFFNLSPDTVRQFSQQSADGGKTWTVEYDFTYRRRKS
jgi:tetratricopeptide (TPR) repeat protein